MKLRAPRTPHLFALRMAVPGWKMPFVLMLSMVTLACVGEPGSANHVISAEGESITFKGVTSSSNSPVKVQVRNTQTQIWETVGAGLSVANGVQVISPGLTIFVFPWAVEATAPPNTAAYWKSACGAPISASGCGSYADFRVVISGNVADTVMGVGRQDSLNENANCVLDAIAQTGTDAYRAAKLCESGLDPEDFGEIKVFNSSFYPGI